MILITEFMNRGAVAKLSAERRTVYAPGLADNQDKLPAMMPGVRALIVRNRTQVTKAVLSAAPDLKCVGRLGVGLDNIDQAACAGCGVTVIAAGGANTVSVAEYVLTAILVLLRNAYQAGDQMLAGGWPRMECSGREVAGKTLGLIGFGATARETAARARALGMNICAHDPLLAPGDAAWRQARRLDLEELLENADAVSLHVPLTADTRHLINAGRLSRMKPGAVLINAARGGVVDEKALADRLRAGGLFGAALDVFETEPLTAEAARCFHGLHNLILTPHIAGVTEESNSRVSLLIARRVLEVLEEKGEAGHGSTCSA